MDPAHVVQATLIICALVAAVVLMTIQHSMY